MKFSLSFLRDYVPTPLNADEAGAVFTMTGLELEETYEAEGETCLDVNIMANRGDAASVLGMAREYAAKRPQDGETDLLKRLRAGCPRPDEAAGDAASLASVAIQAPSCSRFAVRAFLDVENGESPDWLKTRLLQCGQRPISLLVDLTNYVMLEVGQPLHAYDLDLLANQTIVVRQAEDGEVMTTLDGVERTLTPTDMVIADAERAIGIAGVMGGLNTEVGPSTKRCLLEAANFSASSVRKTRRRLSLQTEASFRFERSVDPELVSLALNRFADLYEQITGRQTVPGLIDLYPNPRILTEVAMPHEMVGRLLGLEIPIEECQNYLDRLGFLTRIDGDTLYAIPPTWRFDIVRAEDLVEEVARVKGYELFEERLPIGSTPAGGVHGKEALADAVCDAALRAGLNQAVSHSLGDIHPLDAPTTRLRVRSPHSPEMAWLRNSMLPGLAQAAAKNGGKDQGWFEIGRVIGFGGETVECGFLLTGRLDAIHPLATSATAQFLHMKGIVEAVLRNCSIPHSFSNDSADARLHPTRQARIMGAGPIGCIGQIHPEVADLTGLPADTLLGWLDVDACWREVRPYDVTSKPISRNPAATRDIAVLAPKSLSYDQIKTAIQKGGGEFLEDFWLFDVYEGKGVPEGSHSLAIGLSFRKIGQNFTDGEANQARDSVLAELASIGATLRQ